MILDHLAPYLPLANLAIALISAAAAAFAGWAAWRSTISAREASKRADEAEFRSAYKEVALVAKDCFLTRSRIRHLVPELISALKLSQVARGIQSDSYTDLATRAAHAKLDMAERLTDGLDGFLSSNLAGKVKTSADANKAQIQWGAALAELHQIEQNLAGELAKIMRVAAGATKARQS